MAFYAFVPLDQLEAQQQTLLNLGAELNLKGTILLATEGINGTVVGTSGALDDLEAFLTRRFGDIPCKRSTLAEGNPGFYRFKVKIKAEIVSFGVKGLDIDNNGQHVDAARWNELLSDPHTVVLDTRNQYEVDIGTFPGAVSPETTNFREFPAWVAEHLDTSRHRQIAMFCTGGIRCEKASAYLLAQGFDEVYQLDGGILKYLEDVAPEENRWQGECFVFDQRVSVNEHLHQGSYQQCFACRHPVSAEDMASPLYEQGVQCPHCADQISDPERQGFRERQKQVELASKRGEHHIGGAAASTGELSKGCR